MEIIFLEHDQIDHNKWDECVQRSTNGMIYASAAFLNSLGGKWDALIMGDYHIIMPLIKRKKWGITYLYQPSFAQQTGIIGTNDPNILTAFIEKVKQLVPFAEIHLNFENKVSNSLSKNNQIIHLNRSYSQLEQSFSTYTKRKIKQADNEKTDYKEIDPELNITLYKKLLDNKSVHVKDQDLDQLLRFCVENKNEHIARAVYINEELAASVIGLKYKDRIHLVTLTSNLREKYSFAAHVLVNKIISEFAQYPLILDFEGSDLPGVYSFNEGFGAINQPYFFYQCNQLPWPIRLLKR